MFFEGSRFRFRAFSSRSFTSLSRCLSKEACSNVKRLPRRDSSRHRKLWTLERSNLCTKARGRRLKMTTMTAVERMMVKWGNTTKVVTIGEFQELIFELERMGHTVEKLGDRY